ncbi:phosphatidylinositol-glycan biosynthesis class S protein [Microdochium trichocladiopsis]|uniref:Phosphatidylinositol-glycan biosynthesis class S protein n=1 Tax=Microdochium trichocladiopsis TaxID=1682393 RepID=A0A9P9BHG6_9PEZI|nr:phosphatidylinositol-glycan biosynthesis class S protein [Microdochium trichocladiopsis]KAH7018464.1 phosphatidylinositol-glycan biosynthesis class S protein [Microdochium trichocladiopsis]
MSTPTTADPDGSLGQSTAIEHLSDRAIPASQTAEESTRSTAVTTPPATAQKAPPPEKPADILRRTSVILSFWAIVLCLGLPIWWHTTTIHKATLPLAQMSDWANGLACPPQYPIYVQLAAPNFAPEDYANLLRDTQASLDTLNDGPAGVKLRLQGPDDSSSTSAIESKVAYQVDLELGNELHAFPHKDKPRLSIQFPQSAARSLPSYIAGQLQNVFREERDLVRYYLAHSSIPAERLGDAAKGAVMTDSHLAKRMTRTLRYDPTFHLTISLFTSGSKPSAWDIDAAVAEHMQPVLDMLRPIHNFTIDTQIQLFASPSVDAQVLTKEHLSQFVNAAEWPLSPSIGGAHTINFVIFAGDQIISTDGSAGESWRSWLVPQWGSVYLLAPSSEDYVTADELKLPLQKFTSHLLSLLGVPQSSSPALRLSTLTRVRAIDLMLRASSSLGSLARLTHALPSISIPESVADSVARSIQHLENACANLGTESSLQHAQIAEAEAERAFFEKSMVGQLYFPDEHKIAVYLPLLGPIGVPLVMGLLNEFKAWKKRRSEKLKAT